MPIRRYGRRENKAYWLDLTSAETDQLLDMDNPLGSSPHVRESDGLKQSTEDRTGIKMPSLDGSAGESDSEMKSKAWRNEAKTEKHPRRQR